MTVRILEMPEETAQFTAWLERELVGLRLGNLVRELCALHELQPAQADESRLQGWLEEDRSRLLAKGLGAMPIARLRQLLVHPELLLPLQELVLIEGGPYWQKLLGEVARDENCPLPEPPAIPEFESAAASGPVTVAPHSAKSSSAVQISRRTLAWGLATAAAMLVAVGLFIVRGGNNEPTWGWNEPGLLAARPAETPAAHFSALATAANAWFNQPRETSADLAARIREMRAGCDRLIANAHPALEPADRKWLIDVCREWRKKFDEQLAALDQEHPVGQVRDEMDRIIHHAVQKLQDRGKERAA